MSSHKGNAAGLPIIHDHVAGIDVGSWFHVVAVEADLCQEPVQTFQAFAGDLQRMANSLVATGIKTVATESTTATISRCCSAKYGMLASMSDTGIAPRPALGKRLRVLEGLADVAARAGASP